jgi:hypothetical protein
MNQHYTKDARVPTSLLKEYLRILTHDKTQKDIQDYGTKPRGLLLFECG